MAPEQSLALLDRLRAGQFLEAMAVWQRLRPFEDMRARRANALNVSVVKEALAQLGLCRADVRPPISPLTEPERAEVRTILAGLTVPAAVSV